MRIERCRFVTIISDQFLFLCQRVPAGTLAAWLAVLAHRMPAVNKERKVSA
jgi:hypothetical protein